MSKVLNVTVDFTKSSGGSAISVGQFTRAIPAGVVSLTRLGDLSDSNSYSGTCVHIPVRDDYLGAAYSYLSKANGDRLRALIREAHLVICHKLFRYHAQVVMEECIAAGIPYMVVPHGGLDPYVFTYRRLQKTAWFALVGNRFFRHASGVIYASEREMVKAASRVPFARGHVINWYVQEPQQSSRDLCKARIWRRYGLKPGTRVYLMLGRLHSIKRIPEAVRAFQAAQLPDSALLIAGADDDYSAQEITSFAQRIGASQVRAIGPAYDNDKDDLLGAADYSVNVSHKENYCYSVVEGLSYGAPAILTPGNDLAETLVADGCAFCCTGYDDSDLEDVLRMSSRLGEKDLAAMRTRARAWARTHASFETFCSRLSSLVDSVIHSCATAAVTG